jgi:hypothetical protein
VLVVLRVSRHDRNLLFKTLSKVVLEVSSDEIRACNMRRRRPVQYRQIRTNLLEVTLRVCNLWLARLGTHLKPSAKVAMPTQKLCSRSAGSSSWNVGETLFCIDKAPSFSAK